MHQHSQPAGRSAGAFKRKNKKVFTNAVYDIYGMYDARLMRVTCLMEIRCMCVICVTCLTWMCDVSVVCH